MLCEEVQIEISSGDPLGDAENTHLAECQDCRSFAEFNANVTMEARSWRDEKPQAHLAPNIRAALGAYDRSAQRSFGFRRLRRALWAGAAAALVLALVFFGGRGNAEAAYRRMIQNMASVKTVHYMLYWRPGNGNVGDGPLRKVYELWWQPGLWRETSAPDMGRDSLKVQTDLGMTFSYFDPARGGVVTESESSPQISTFGIEDIAGRLMDIPASYEEASLNTDTELITVTNAGNWSRVLFYVDVASHLPIRGDKQYRDSRGWQTSGHFEIQFNQPIDPSKFNPATLRAG